MIFVVLGTQDKPFLRLLQAVEEAANSGLLTEEIIVQTGSTEFKSKKMKVCEGVIPMKEFDSLIQKSSVAICHAGYGILSTALNYGKKVIAVARLAEYGEHQNNHQNDILDYYEEKGFVLALRDFSKFDEVWKKIPDFKPKKYSSSFERLKNFLAKYIEENS